MLFSLVSVAPIRPDRVVLAEFKVPVISVHEETLSHCGLVVLGVLFVAAVAALYTARLRKKKIPAAANGTSISETT